MAELRRLLPEITRDNLERFWLGGAAHDRRDECAVWRDRARERKTSWAKASGENRYGDSFDVSGIDQWCCRPFGGPAQW